MNVWNEWKKETREQCQKEKISELLMKQLKEKIIDESKKTYKRACRSGEIPATPT
jgi:hypothetical protein